MFIYGKSQSMQSRKTCLFGFAFTIINESGVKCIIAMKRQQCKNHKINGNIYIEFNPRRRRTVGQAFHARTDEKVSFHSVNGTSILRFPTPPPPPPLGFPR